MTCSTWAGSSNRIGRYLLVLGLVFTARAPCLAGNTGFVHADGIDFILNGRRVYFAGTNNYYQMIHRRTGQPGVDEVPDEMAERSITVLRTWAFQELIERGDCLQCAPAQQLGLDERPVDFVDEATLVALDETLAAADARGIRVILTLVNNWDDFGGMNRYTLWRFGSEDHDQFYVDATIEGWFKDLIDLLVTRVNSVNGRVYRDDPTIFAWQLSNEARLMSEGVSPAELDEWIGEMSSYIKSLDPNHMVSTGIEGFYGPEHAGKNTNPWMTSQGTDFIANHQHSAVDYATCHVWPQNWLWDPIGDADAAVAKATQYLLYRIDDSEIVLGKPLMVEEFGLPRDNFGVGIDSGPTTVRERFHQDVFYSLSEASAIDGGPLGGTANWLILDDPTEDYDDGNGIFLPWDEAMDSILTGHAQLLATLFDHDFDQDGDVDLDDHAAFGECMVGPGATPAPDPPTSTEQCLGAFDVDEEGDVDLRDFAEFQRFYTGS